MDPAHFPEPETFQPERWLGPDASQLEKRLVAFSHGSRSCIGMNLAYEELYLNFSYVFRKFDMKPYKTTKASMDWKDNFVPTTTEHLRVTLTKVDG
jgi:cytochrome P450